MCYWAVITKFLQYENFCHMRFYCHLYWRYMQNSGCPIIMQTVSSFKESKTRASQVLTRGQADLFLSLHNLPGYCGAPWKQAWQWHVRTFSHKPTWEEHDNVITQEHTQSREALHLLQPPVVLCLNFQGQQDFVEVASTTMPGQVWAFSNIDGEPIPRAIQADVSCVCASRWREKLPWHMHQVLCHHILAGEEHHR